MFRQDRTAIDRHTRCRLNVRHEVGTSAVTRLAISQLDEYFNGRRHTFTIPMLLTGSCFRRQVWQEVMNIPYGQTISYAELARRIGRPGAARAVASACAANPILLLVPCHRVIASNGHPAGYAGGADLKRTLLAMEAQTFARSSPAR